MLRFLLLVLAAVVLGMMGGWMFPAETPGNLSTVAPANISSAQTFRTAPLSSQPSPSATLTTSPASSYAPEAIPKMSGSGQVAKKRELLKVRLATATVQAGLQATRHGDDDEDDDDDDC